VRLLSIDVTDVPPVKKFFAEALSDTVVFAGPNGVGKTRLITEIILRLQDARAQRPNVALIIEATSAEEEAAWGVKSLNTRNSGDWAKLKNTIQSNRPRRNWRSSILRFESDRTISQIQPFASSWDITDPYEEQVEWTTSFHSMRARFQDTVHSLFRLIEHQKHEIANQAIQLRRDGHDSMPLEFPDPVAAFKNAFASLLAPKELADLQPKTQILEYILNGERFPFDSLSSGEREVVNIVFDFLLRRPQDCIVFFDEPELHLHPELSYKMIRTLRESGENNQFIFCTHSPDIISAALEQSVVFVSPPGQAPDGSPVNQAVPVAEDDETNQALRLLGQSVGIVALGKRIVLIEGTGSSLDKQVYGSILGNRYPGLVLVPTGGKDTIRSFAAVHERVLSRSIWGVEFFMLCDRDAVPFGMEPVADSARFCVLPRYHLENYFLDEQVWARVFDSMEAVGSWLRDPRDVRDALVQIANGLTSYSAALVAAAATRRLAGNIDIMPKDCHGKTRDELLGLLVERAAAEGTRVQKELHPESISRQADQHFSSIKASLDGGTDEWKKMMPGRPILNQFVAKTGLGIDRAKRLYIAETLKGSGDVFEEINVIFRTFAEGG
jgi:hypothetical protein